MILSEPRRLLREDEEEKVETGASDVIAVEVVVSAAAADVATRSAVAVVASMVEDSAESLFVVGEI